MTGKSQSEAVAVLRALAPDSVVAVIVSRQVVDDTPDVLPPSSDTVIVSLVVSHQYQYSPSCNCVGLCVLILWISLHSNSDSS